MDDALRRAYRKKYRSDVSTSSSPPQPPSTTALRKRPRPSFAPFSNNLLLLFSLLLLAFKRMHAVWKSMHAQACLLLVTSGVCGVVEWPKDNLWPRLRKVRGAQNGSGVSVRLRFCLFASLLMKQFAVRHRFYRSCVLVFVHSFIHSCRTTLLMNAGRMQLLRRRIWTKFFNTRAIRQAPGASAKEENFGRMNE